MDSSPRGEGGKGLLRAGVALAGEQVAGRDDRAVAAPAQPPRDEQLQSRQLLHKLESEVRNLEMCAVVPLAAARQSEVPRTWCYNEDPPVPAGHQKPLEVGDSRSESDLVNHHEFPLDVVEAIFQLGDSRNLTVLVCTTEAGIIQAVNHNRRLFW